MKHDQLRVLFFTRYSSQGASSRCRTYQFVRRLDAQGIRATISPLLDDAYLSQKYAGASRVLLAGHLIRALLTRAMRAFTVSRYDAVVVEKELLPYVPYAIERFLLRRARHFFTDHDDALRLQYAASTLLRGKVDLLMRDSTAVFVGSHYLANVAHSLGAKVVFLPTVVDLDRYPPPKPKTQSTPVVVGWIGTPITAQYLSLVAPALRILASKVPIVLRTIGAGDVLPVTGILVDRRPWTFDTEVADLTSIDIGIMPLTNDEWSEGKCGYKLIQYMACGIPTVASPIGENKTILQDRKTGFLASSQEEWVNAILALCKDPTLRREFGTAGRARVEQHYTLEGAANLLATTLRDSIRSAHPCAV